MHQCTNAPMRQCANAPMHQCTNAPMHQCANAPMLCQAMNTDVDGSTLVVHSRLSLNLAGGTLEQVHITGINSIAPVRVAMQQYQCTSCSAPRVRLFMHWYLCPATHKTPIPMPMPMPPPPSTSLRHPEQVLSRRRRMLMDMVDGFELEVRDGDTNALIRRMSN